MCKLDADCEDGATQGMLMPNDEDNDDIDDAKSLPKTDWSSIYLCSLCQFFSGAQFGLFFMSMFPFLKTLDPTNTEAFYGLLIAMFSLAQIISSPLVGWLSNCLGGKLRLILIGLECFMLAGNCIYFFAEIFPKGWARNSLVLARFFVGIGSGNLGLFESYVSVASDFADRSRAIALVTSGVALGSTFGPIFQMYFSWIGYPGFSLIGPIHLSMFTAPALFAAILNIFNLICLKFFFKENYVNLIGHKNRKEIQKMNLEKKNINSLPPYDRLALLVCYGMRFTQTVIFTNIQTLGASFSMLMFSWTPTEVVRFGSLSHAAKGLISFIVFLAYILTDLGKRINERLVCFCSLFSLLLFHILTFSWPFLPNEVEYFDGKSSNDSSTIHHHKSVHPGCDQSQFNWCSGLKRVNGLLFNILYAIIFGTAFPNIHVAMRTIFSKIIGPRLQGTQQGLMQMAAGIGRLVGPLMIGYIYIWEGPRAVWILEIGVIIAMTFIWFLAYQRLVPLRMEEEDE